MRALSYDDIQDAAWEPLEPLTTRASSTQTVVQDMIDVSVQVDQSFHISAPTSGNWEPLRLQSVVYSYNIHASASDQGAGSSHALPETTEPLIQTTIDKDNHDCMGIAREDSDMHKSATLLEVTSALDAIGADCKSAILKNDTFTFWHGKLYPAIAAHIKAALSEQPTMLSLCKQYTNAILACVGPSYGASCATDTADVRRNRRAEVTLFC